MGENRLSEYSNCFGFSLTGSVGEWEARRETPMPHVSICFVFLL